jgi:hypothetical protein
MDPFVRVEAETMDDQNGIYTEVCSPGGMNVTNIEDGDWIKVRGVDFGTTGAGAFSAGVACELKYGTTKGGSIEIRIDDVSGTLIGTVPVSYTGGPDIWKTETITVDEVTGVHDVYFAFTGEDDENLFYFDYWYFTEKTGSHDLLAVNAFVDDYKIDTVPGYDSTYITVTAVYTDGTSEFAGSGTAFTFDQENIVSVTDSLITGLDYGSVTVYATYSDSTDSVKVIVKNLESELIVSRIYADSSDVEVAAGTSASVIISAEFEDEHIEDVTNDADYDSPSPEIATISNGVINAVSEGEVDITVSYQGELGEAKSTTIHVTVSSGSGVWLEAECGTVGSLWTIVSNSNASHGEYVTIRPGNNSTDAAPADTSGQLSFTFDISASGTYTVYTRVTCPSANDDSFWFKMDDGAFVSWNNIEGSSSWIWTYFPSTYELDAGSHTLTIGYREDGALLDKLWISASADAELVGQGDEADNCSDDGPSSLVSKNMDGIQVFPNPVTDELNISLPTVSAGISIYSTDGREIFSRYVRSAEMTINMENYNRGIYFLKITGEGQTVVRKIVKE